MQVSEMLFVFHVDTGTMLTFDMNVAMQRSVCLHVCLDDCQVFPVCLSVWLRDVPDIWSNQISSHYSLPIPVLDSQETG